MKQKLLLLITLLGLSASGAWATTVNVVTLGSQVTDLSNLSADKYYVLQNVGTSKYNYYDAANSQMDAKATLDYSCVVVLNYDNTNVTIKQVSTGTYYQGLVSDTRLTLGADAVNYTFNTESVNSGEFRFANNSLFLNRNGSEDWPMGYLTSGMGNYSRWKIYEVTIASFTRVEAQSDIDVDKCYNIENPRGWWAVADGTTEVNSTAELSLAASASDTKQQFAFVKYNEQYYLYSVSTGMFAYVNGTKLSLTAIFNSDVIASPVTFTASQYSSTSTDYPTVISVGGKNFGVSTGFSPDVYQYTSTNDEGNGSAIVEAGSFDKTNAQDAIANYTASPSFSSSSSYFLKNLINNFYLPENGLTLSSTENTAASIVQLEYLGGHKDGQA